MNKLKIKHKKGQTLVEVLLAIGISVMVIGAIVMLGSVSIRISQSALRRSEASALASSGVDAVRYYRDVNGYDALKNGFYFVGSNGAFSECGGSCGSENFVKVDTGGSSGTFERKIEVSDYERDSKKIVTTIRWTEGRVGYKNVVMSTVVGKQN